MRVLLAIFVFLLSVQGWSQSLIPFRELKANAIFSTPLSCYPGQLTTFSLGTNGSLPEATALNASRWGFANLAGWSVGVSVGLEYNTAALKVLTIPTNFCGTVGTSSGSSVMGVRSFQPSVSPFQSPFALKITNALAKVSYGCWIKSGYPDVATGTHDILTIYGTAGGEFCNLDLVGTGIYQQIVLEKGQGVTGALTPNSTMTNGVWYWVTGLYDSTGATDKHALSYYNSAGAFLGSNTVLTNTVSPMPLPDRITLGVQNRDGADVSGDLTWYIDYASFVYNPSGTYPILPSLQ